MMNYLKTITVIFILLASLMVRGSPESIGLEKVLHVGGSGAGNYTTIQSAIDNASDGFTIYVYDDSAPYHEHIVITKQISLVGENAESTIIDGGGEGSVITIKAPSSISNFTVTNSGRNESDAGIYCMYESDIKNNIIYNSGDGINIRATGSVVENNKIFDCRTGIFMGNGSQNILGGNNITSKYGVGIWISNSNWNLIINNTIDEIEFSSGVFLGGTGNYFSDNTIISETHNGMSLSGNRNVVENNSFYGSGLEYFYEYHSNRVRNNTVNGKPLAYIENASDIELEKDAGQIILVNCSNITIKNQEISNTTVGIFLFNSQRCKIYSSKISDNWIGINLFKSTFNDIRGNDISSCGYAGVDIAPFSGKNKINANLIKNNSRGITTWSDNNTISGNTIADNWHGIHLDYGSYENMITENIIMYNAEGITIWQESSGNKILNNSIENNDRGISLSYNCLKNNIERNSISRNEYGIDISSSSDETTVQKNDFLYNSIGIRVGSFSNTITKNNFVDNSRDATFIYPGNLKPSLNDWNGNYWGSPHLLPKPIWGWRFPFPWVNFDFHPLSQPYSK